MFGGFLKIDEPSKVPEYQQIADKITSDIEIGLVKAGYRIPSINETSEEFYLSRDAVEKAYRVLRKRTMIALVISNFGFSKPSKCNYNPYTFKWNYWQTSRYVESFSSFF